MLGTVLATGWKAGKSALEYYRKAEATKAIGVAVVRSEPTQHGYRLDFQFVNATAHGVYLEEILLLDPDADILNLRLLPFTIHDTAMLDAPPPGPGIALGATAPPAGGRVGPRGRRALPVLIQPAGTTTLSLFVQPDAKLWFDRASVGIGRAKVSFLDHDTPQEIAWRFLIRRP